MLVKIPGTEKWINPAYVVSMCTLARYTGSGHSISITYIEKPNGHEETTASIEEVLAAIEETNE